jgi:hypothetical protein
MMHLISITTRCETVETFLDLFHRYIDPEDKALFIAAPDPREIGTRAPFQIRLRDGTIVMRGEAEVVRRWAGDGLDSPWARPGYCIKISALESDSQEIYSDLIDGAKKVAPAARRMVPPVAAPQSRPIDAEPEPAPEPPQRNEKSFQLDLGDLVPVEQGSLLPTGTESDPLWGVLPPPPPPRPGLADLPRLIRGSRRLQIATGVMAGIVVGTLLAIVTHGDGDKVFVSPSAEAPRPAPAAPSPIEKPAEPVSPAAPAPERPAADPPAEPPAASHVVLDLRSDPPGAIFFVDGKKVGKAPVKVKVKAGRKVKVEARLKGYPDWKDRIRARDDRKVTARLNGKPRF